MATKLYKVSLWRYPTEYEVHAESGVEAVKIAKTDFLHSVWQSEAEEIKGDSESPISPSKCLREGCNNHSGDDFYCSTECSHADACEEAIREAEMDSKESNQVIGESSI